MATNKFSPDSTVNDSLYNNVTNTGILTGTGREFAMNDCRQVGGFIKYDVGDPPTAGVIIAEGVPSQGYTGAGQLFNTWTLANIVAGTEDPSWTYPGPVAFIRYRFTTPSDKVIQAYVNGLLN